MGRHRQWTCRSTSKVRDRERQRQLHRSFGRCHIFGNDVHFSAISEKEIPEPCCSVYRVCLGHLTRGPKVVVAESTTTHINKRWLCFWTPWMCTGRYMSGSVDQLFFWHNWGLLFGCVRLPPSRVAWTTIIKAENQQPTALKPTCYTHTSNPRHNYDFTISSGIIT